jgi:hypothetical protein
MNISLVAKIFRIVSKRHYFLTGALFFRETIPAPGFSTTRPGPISRRSSLIEPKAAPLAGIVPGYSGPTIHRKPENRSLDWYFHLSM